MKKGGAVNPQARWPTRSRRVWRIAKFKEKSRHGMTRFGSGWSVAGRQQGQELKAYSTANQDSPLMEGDVPIPAWDVWESRVLPEVPELRRTTLDAWWNVCQLGRSAARFDKAK